MDDRTDLRAAIDALPPRVKEYIMHLETRCDPAGEVAELMLTRDQNKQLLSKFELLENLV